MLQNLITKLNDLFTNFYYRQYFTLGLPTRHFIQVNIETNTICNRSCHFCIHGIRNNIPPNPMPANLFFNIIDQLVNTNFAGRLSLFNTNEPLTDKRIYDFIQYTSLMLPNCYHTLVSNGDILNYARLDKLFTNGLDLLLLNSYDNTALQKNQNLYEYAHNKYPNKILHTNRTTYTNWISRAGHIAQYAKTPVTDFCDLPNYALFINPKGQVSSCCHDFDAQNLLGDLTQQTINQIWYGAAFTTFRQQLNYGNRKISKLCNNCDYTPDLNYFKWNDQQPRLHGKGSRWWPRKSNANNLIIAQAIKRKYLEREKNSDSTQIQP